MAKKDKKGFLTEFKEFITKGNVLDMAVGVIIGNSFKAIVTALTDKILMPCITELMGNKSLDDLKYVFRPEELNEAGEVIVTENAIYYGAFLQSIIDFLLVALVLFVIVKSAMAFQKKRLALIEKFKKQEEEVAEEPAAPAEPTIEEKNAAVLAEIRDQLIKLNEKK